MGLLGGLAVLLSACGGSPQSVLDPQGSFAERPDDLFRIVFWIAVAIFVLVQGLIIVTVVRFRDRGGEQLPEQVHGNTKLEIFWTVVPALILAAIAVPTVQLVFELDAPQPDSMTVEVVGHRWWWEFRYPGDQFGLQEDVVTANELVIPTGRTVRLEMTSQDPGASTDKAVIHSFWVPALAGKQDVVPGRISTLNLEADEPGRYLGQCAEYCGLSHANMRQRVVAKSPGEFDRWLAAQAEPAPTPEQGTQAFEGMRTFLTGACAGCHTVDGAEITVDGQSRTAQGRIGPDLTHLMSRREFAGAILDLYERDQDGDFTGTPHVENLRAWLDNPDNLKPMQATTNVGIGMPDVNLTDEEIDALVTYLVTLE